MEQVTQLPDGGQLVAMLLGNERERWLEIKRQGIGGSQAAAVLGASPFTSPAKVWATITGRMEGDPENNAMRMGLAMEQMTADLFMDETGLPVHRYGSDNIMLWQRADRPWHLYSPDGVVDDPARGRCLYEGKTGSADFVAEWEGGEVPLAYYFQGQWGCAIDPTIAGVWYAALLGGRIYGEPGSFHLRHVFVPRHDSVCATMVERIGEWWERHVVGDEPPMVGADDKEVLQQAFPANSGKTVQLETVTLDGSTYDLADLLRERAEIKDRLQPELDRVETIENVLRLATGDADGFTHPDGSRYTNKCVKAGMTVDLKQLQADLPKMYDLLASRFPKATGGYRRPYYYPTTKEQE